MIQMRLFVSTSKQLDVWNTAIDFNEISVIFPYLDVKHLDHDSNIILL